MAIEAQRSVKQRKAASEDESRKWRDRLQRLIAALAAYVWWGLEASEEEELTLGWSGR